MATRGVEKNAIQLSREYPRSDGIHTDPLVTPLHRERSRQGSDRGLAGAIGCDSIESNIGRERRNIDDAAILLCQHRLSEDLATSERPFEVDVHDAVP